MKRKFTFLIAAALMLLTMMATTGTMWGETVKYTITSRNTLTTTGTAPTGSSATIVETYGTSCQMTKGNSQTLTLTNYYGYSISNITLSMKSNQSSGAGKLSYSTDGGTTFTYIVGSSNAGVSFNQAAWNGSWSTSYVDISKDVTIIPESGKNIIIKIEATANSLYCRSYQLTYTSGTTCATPTFTPAAGAVLSGSTVAISTTTDGATIYYTMGANPDDPTTSSDVYSEPIEITEATTIKAMAVKDGYNNSSIASASYTIATPLTTMAQIFDDATANTSAHQVFITFDNWVITGNNGNNPTTAFLSDGTNGCRIYNNGGVGFAKGDILSGTASCNLSLYYGMAQLNLTSAASGLTIQTGGEVTPVVTTIDALTGIKAGSVVTLQGLTYNGSILTYGENSITPYNYMYSASLENDHVYNVTGVFEYGYNSVKRINPRDENDIEEVIITTPTISASNVDIACTATGGEIAYTINNPVDGGSLSATTESDWLILNSNFDSPIAFTCSSNTATEERTATVALTYTYNAKASVTKNVTVTQAAYEAPNVTWDLSTDQTATATTTEMTWTSNYVTMAVAKGSASTNTNNYYPGTSGQNYTSTRFYKNSILTITPVAGYDLSSIEFTATTEGYATTLKNSTWTNATASVSGTIVTVTPTNGTTAISATIGGTCGFTSVKVYYTESSDPAVATTVTIDATGITNTDVYTSTEAGSLSATVHAGETLIDGASVTWESSNSDAATIDENGVVTLVAAGTTTITASYAGVANTYKPSSATYELTVINSNAPGTENNPYTVADAMAAIDAQGTINEAYVTGIVSQVDSYNSSYHSITYWISDDGETTTQLEVYSGKGLNGANFSSVADVQVGATVVVKGKLKLYNQTYEFDYNNELVSYTAPQVTVEAPTFSPAAGGYAETQTVAITCATEGAQIYYTNDGSDPTNESFLYDEEIDIEETTTIKAIAYVGENASTVSTAAYYILSNENTYTVTQALEFETYPQNNIFVEGIVSTAPTSLLDGGLLTYYISVDGTETNRLQVYKGKNLGNTEFTAQDNIQVGDRVTIFGNVKTYNEIKEFDQGNYLVTWERLETVATPTFTPEEGEYAEAQSVTIACATEGATIYYKTAENAEWAVYSEAINVTETTTIWAYAAKDGMNNSAVATATYTINIPVPSITVTPGEVDIVDAGGGGTLTATYINMGDVDDILADIVFYESDGTTPATYDWITVNINNNDNTVVEYLAEENEGAARTAYFKVYGTTDGDNFTYSNLVTISQAAHVTPPTTDNYELYNGALVEGDYLIVYDGVAMNNVTLNDRLQYGDVEITEDVISTSNATIVWHIAPSGDYWTIYSADANAYAASTGAKSKAQMLADGTDDKALWTVSGTSTYEFVNKQNTANNVNANLRRNGTYGFACYATSTGGALSLYKKASTEPAITLDSYSIEANAEGLKGNLTVTYTNYENPDDIETVVWFCDENGENAVEYDWIVAEIDDKDVTNLYYIIDANNGAARTAYFKVHETSEDIYSELVTITQEAYVATITVVPAEVTDVPAAGDVPEHTVTLANLTISSADDFEFVYCDSEGNILGNEDPKPNWIELADAEYDLDSENVYTMMYTIAENTETTPRTGYFKIGVTQTSETVYSNLVTVTQEAAAAPTFTVSFTFDGGTFVPNEDFTEEIVEIEAGTYNLPSATKEGYTFDGWNDGNATYEAGAEYTVSADVEFTALWTEVVGVTYELVTSTDDIVPDCYYLITSGTDGTVKAMAGQNTNNRAAVTVTASDGVISNIGDAVEFIISGDGTDLNPYTIYDENVPGYLYAAGTNSSNYLKTQGVINERAQWTITIDNDNKAIITALTTETDRKVIRYNSTSGSNGIFSCYGSTSQQPIYLFKKADNSPSISADNVNIEYNATSGSIIYEINNYVEGEMVATTTADWISDFIYEQVDEIGTVDFTATANESYVSRSATVTLTYTYDDSKATVTKDVTVTQNGQPSITVSPATANVAFAGGTPEFAVTYESLEITKADDFDVEFYETPTSTTAGNQPSWITNVAITGNTTDGFTLTVTVAANDGDARDAYLKVYAAGSNDYIYSNLVTINQAAFVQLTTYSLVTSVDQIVSGKHYLFVGYKGEVAYAMGYDKGNNRNAVEVTVDNNTIPETVGAYEFVINNSGEDWTIYDNNVQELNTNDTYGFLYAAGGTSNNYLKTRTTNNDNKGIWTITIDDETHVASITAKSTGRNKMRFNDGNSPLFSCYSDGQKDIYLYVKDNDNNLEYYGTEITYSGNSIPDGGSITVGAGSVMTVPNNFENNDPNALVIEEGGQLIHTADVEATVQKSVSGYTNKSGDGWYLISSPVDNLPTSSVATGTYDLFAYDEATAYWWVDHAIQGQPAYHTFTTLERGKGYLYANAANVNLNYAGTMKATNANITVDLSFECDAYPDLRGFNLMGNPFSRNLGEGDMTVGSTAVTMYYGFDDAREEFETKTIASTPIKPGQGFFIQATEAGQQLVFNPATSKDASDFKYISISAGDENFTDKAYIQFGYGNTLRKMTFGENTMVYVMNDDMDYAAARVEELAGTMPVHFVPIQDGFYTITIETKNIENLNYMHLIDNIKNTEIDLLVEPSYTFKASESDNADRFYLVFDFNNYTGVNENYTNGNFAYQIGDEIFVSGEGTLQVFDMLGRFVAGYNVNGDKRISTAEFNTGVYIFRMVGTEVKTQKIIVR